MLGLLISVLCDVGQIIQHLFALVSPSVKWDGAVFLSHDSTCTLNEIICKRT